MMDRAIRTMLVAVMTAAITSLHPALALASPRLSQQLAGKSLRCGLGSDLYFDPRMGTASVVDAASGPFPITENRTTIEPARVKSDDARLFEVVLKTSAGETHHRFERRERIFLRLGDSDVDDACVLTAGRAAYVETRFDMIREGVCGNDPKPSCEKGLAKTCGPHPDAACVRRFAARKG